MELKILVLIFVLKIIIIKRRIIIKLKKKIQWTDVLKFSQTICRLFSKKEV